jgi:hypothetical protein
MIIIMIKKLIFKFFIYKYYNMLTHLLTTIQPIQNQIEQLNYTEIHKFSPNNETQFNSARDTNVNHTNIIRIHTTICN